jgi:spectrin beta
VDDYGKDLAGVQALQRKQDDIERDMTALHQQLQVCLSNYANISGFTNF